MTIRPARDDDAAHIAEIYAHYARNSVLTPDVDAPPGVEEWRSRLVAADATDRPVLVVVEDGRVMGYALLSAWISKPAFAHTVESSIYLAPGADGRGLGRPLLERLLERGRTQGVREVMAFVADPDEQGRRSARLHRRCGFVFAGRLRGVGFKHGRWVDVEVLQLSLHASRAPEL